MCRFALLATLLLALGQISTQSQSVFPPPPLQQQACGGQVQICAPLSNLPGQEAYLGGLRGKKGETGAPGRDGKPGVTDISGLEEKVASLEAELQSVKDNSKTVCPSLTFTFPRERQNLDYVWYRGYVPSLKAATACAWINVTDVSHSFAIASYAATHDNEFLIFSTRQNIIDPHIDGKKYSFAYHWVPNVQVHICTWFDSQSDVLGFSVNGLIQQTKSYTGGAISSGGSFIFGQDQDAKNAGRLDASQSFTGTIGNFFMWPRVLTPAEIRAVAHDCICPVDYVIAPSMQNVELYGDVSYDVPEMCPAIM